MFNLIRWLAVLPSAFLAAVLSAFPLHLVLYSTLTSETFSFNPYPETPERVLLPLVAAIAFIWVGSKVAPSNQLKTAYGLLVIWLAMAMVVFAMVLSGFRVGGEELIIHGGGLAAITALLGAFAGVYIVKTQSEEKK